MKKMHKYIFTNCRCISDAYFCLLTPSVKESIEFLLVSLGFDMVGFSCMSWFLGGSSRGETVIDFPTTTGILVLKDASKFEAPPTLLEDT